MNLEDMLSDFPDIKQLRAEQTHRQIEAERRAFWDRQYHQATNDGEPLAEARITADEALALRDEKFGYQIEVNKDGNETG